MNATGKWALSASMNANLIQLPGGMVVRRPVDRTATFFRKSRSSFTCSRSLRSCSSSVARRASRRAARREEVALAPSLPHPLVQRAMSHAELLRDFGQRLVALDRHPRRALLELRGLSLRSFLPPLLILILAERGVHGSGASRARDVPGIPASRHPGIPASWHPGDEADAAAASKRRGSSWCGIAIRMCRGQSLACEPACARKRSGPRSPACTRLLRCGALHQPPQPRQLVVERVLEVAHLHDARSGRRAAGRIEGRLLDEAAR